MRLLLKMLIMVLLLVIVGCSQETKRFKDYIDVQEVESMSMDVLDRSSGKSDDNETIDAFYQVIKEVQLTKATKEEMLEIHQESYVADQQSILGWINPDQETNVSVINILKDGRLCFLKRIPLQIRMYL